MDLKAAKRKIARQARTRKRVRGNDSRPRLHVFRSNRFIYAQIINDDAGKTLVSASEKEINNNKVTKTEKAKLVGELLAQKAKKAKISKVCFDRGAYKYHGRVKNLAAAARNSGLEF